MTCQGVILESGKRALSVWSSAALNYCKERVFSLHECRMRLEPLPAASSTFKEDT